MTRGSDIQFLMQFTVTVPADYKNPVPAEWAPFQVGRALDLGVLCVQYLSKSNTAEVDSQNKGRIEMLEAVKRVIAENRSEEIKALAAEVQTTTIQRNEQNALFMDACQQVRTIRGQLDAKHTCELADVKAQHAAELAEKACLLAQRDELYTSQTRTVVAELQLTHAAHIDSAADEKIRSAQEQMRASVEQMEKDRTALVDMMKIRDQTILVQQASNKHLEAELCAERCRLEELQAKYARMHIPANRGAAAENDIAAIVGAYGLHAINTSKGTHNKRYHDLLLSAVPLVEARASDGHILYVSGRSVRLSVESKKYTRPAGLTAEIETFTRVQTGMLTTRRADCFLFVVSGTAIPGRPRFKLEFECHDGRRHITAYLGGTDVTQHEIAQAALVIMQCQHHIDAVACTSGKPENVVLDALQKAIVAFTLELPTALRLADETVRTADVSLKAANELRFNLLTTLLKTRIQTLECVPFTQRMPEVDDAIQSIRARTGRIKTCRLLRSTAEYHKLISTLTCESDDATTDPKKQKTCTPSNNTLETHFVRE